MLRPATMLPSLAIPEPLSAMIAPSARTDVLKCTSPRFVPISIDPS